MLDLAATKRLFSNSGSYIKTIEAAAAAAAAAAAPKRELAAAGRRS